MKSIQVTIHPLSTLAGAAILGGAFLLSSMQGTSTTVPLITLTAEQAQILSHQSIVFLDDGQGGTAKTIRFKGVNIQVVDGSGTTAGPSGLGNVIVGYNESGVVSDRTGAHNFVSGSQNDYSSYGGIVSSFGNSIEAPFACITGGQLNVASGVAASVSAGIQNSATGDGSTVSGGQENIAGGIGAAVSGGKDNESSSNWASVSGGSSNIASNRWASVSGGSGNIASEFFTSITGGESNSATELGATVTGGRLNLANGEYCVVSGGQNNIAGRGSFGMGFVNSATVSGGFNNIASGFGASVTGGEGNEAGRALSGVQGDYSSITGGRMNRAAADWSTVSGGMNRQVIGDDDWRAGTLFENN